MEFIKINVAIAEKTRTDLVDRQVRALNDLHLALIGGGSAIVIIG